MKLLNYKTGKIVRNNSENFPEFIRKEVVLFASVHVKFILSRKYSKRSVPESLGRFFCVCDYLVAIINQTRNKPILTVWQTNKKVMI